ncbi:MAG: phage recombination protein Bet [Vicinamibacterales bacterium]
MSRRGITEAQWRTLANNLYPGAKPESVLMVVDYCAARRLDPLKKPCHIVPMRVKGADGQWGWRDVVMPGIYEYRTTAHRTGLYLGHTEPAFGPVVEFGGVEAPEYCALTVKRWNRALGVVAEFPVVVYFAEVCGLKDNKANERWARAPRQMLVKCAEAAGLREAFPEEFGGEATAEEMDGQASAAPVPVATLVQMPRRQSETAPAPVTPAVVDAEPVETEAPAPEVPSTPADDGDRILQMEARTKGDDRYWLLRTARGVKGYTRNADVAGALERARASGAPVRLTLNEPAANGLQEVIEVASVEG